MECLKALEERITQQELDSIYLVLDMKPEQGSLQEQLYAVRRFSPCRSAMTAAAFADFISAEKSIRAAEQDRTAIRRNHVI